MGPPISRITARIFVQTMINTSELGYINLNVINSPKKVQDKLGETSRQDTRNTSITSNSVRTTTNMHNTSWTHTMNMNKWKTPWKPANNFIYPNY
jgi:hypothetical protein